MGRARMPDPYGDDDGGDNVDGLMDTFRDNVKSGSRDEPTDEGDDIDDDLGGEEPRGRQSGRFEEVTTFADDDEDDDLDITAPKKRRTEQRAERGGIHDALMGSRDENDRLRQRLELLESKANRYEAEGVEDDEVDALEEEIESLESSQKSTLGEYNKGGWTPERQLELQAIAQKNEKKLRKLQFKQMVREEGLGPAQDPAQAQRAALHAQVSTSAPDIYADPEARALLSAKYNIARKRGEADGMELHARMCEDVRAELGMLSRERRPAPTDHQRRAYSGRSKGGSGGKRSGKATSIRMTEDRRTMADLAYPNEPDERKRHKKWALEVGAELVRNGEA